MFFLLVRCLAYLYRSCNGFLHYCSDNSNMICSNDLLGLVWFSISELPANKILAFVNICSVNIKYQQQFRPVILLDWSEVDLAPKSTPYVKKLVELQDSNAAPDRIYSINSKSQHQVSVQVRKEDLIKLIKQSLNRSV